MAWDWQVQGTSPTVHESPDRYLTPNVPHNVMQQKEADKDCGGRPAAGSQQQITFTRFEPQQAQRESHGPDPWSAFTETDFGGE